MRSVSGGAGSTDGIGTVGQKRGCMTMATTRIAAGTIENASAGGALTIAAGAAVMHRVRQQPCDAAGIRQHPPAGIVAAITAITSTVTTEHRTQVSSIHPAARDMSRIKPPCDGNHAAS